MLKENMRSFLVYFRSHRKAVLVLAAFVLVGALFLVGSGKKQQLSGRSGFATADNTAREGQLKKLQQDTDGDGLRDWEEALYHTDRHNPDTDGDGTPDGEEVKLGRDPLKSNTSKNPAEPSDYVATSTPEILQGDSMPAENLTRRLAEDIGKQIIVNRIAHPDIPFDPQAAGQDLVENFTNSLPNDIPSPLTEKDIVIGHDDTGQAVKAYEISLQNVVTANFKGLYTKPDIQIFSEAMDTQDYGKLKALDPYLAGYDRAITQLKKLPVPPRLAALHVEYVNLAIAQEDTIRKMRGAGDDPVAALVAAKQYIAIQERLQTLFDKLGAESRKAGA